MREVFVSHASVDSANAMDLVNALEAEGVSCWVAPRDVGSGTDYTEEIIEALQCARVLVLLGSAGAYQSQHVQREIRLAVEMDLSIVPVQLDDAVLPPMFNYCLSGSQRLDARGSAARDWADQVLATIRRLDDSPAGFPDVLPLRSVSQARRRSNLPAESTTFVGREREVSLILDLFADARLVTLIGAGGAGKTRLACHVASQMLDATADGPWLIELAPISDGTLIADVLGNTLDIRASGNAPLEDTIVDVIGSRSILILLDNCEHVLPDAARICDRLLRTCPNVTLLVTSRERLGVNGEHLLRVPSLTLPEPNERDPAVVARSEAVRLFTDRVGQYRPSFSVDAGNAEVVSRLCRRLDGIPLAVELAAARSRSMTIEELEARLDQRFRILTGGDRAALPRQQTLEALIDWSYDLLDDASRSLLARTSVFAGSWDLEAAEAVCAGGVVDEAAVLDLLDGIVDRSLVHADDATGATRYRLLETVRAYGAIKLEQAGPDEVARTRAAHRLHYVTLGEAAETRLGGATQREWFERLDEEHDNLRSAIESCLADGVPGEGLRLTTALFRYYECRGLNTEGATAISTLLAHPEARATPALVRGHALTRLSFLQVAIGRVDAAQAAIDRAADIANTSGDALFRGWLLLAQAAIDQWTGEMASGLQHADEALMIAEEVDDAALMNWTLMIRFGCQCLAEQLDLDEARAECMRVRDVAIASGDRLIAAASDANLGCLERAAGRPSAARQHFATAIATCREFGDVQLLAHCLTELALAEVAAGAVGAAREHLKEALLLHGWIGGFAGEGLLGCAMTSDDPLRAATLHGALAGVLEDLTGQNAFGEQEANALRDDHVERLRSVLGDARYETAFESGRRLDRSEWMKLAMDGL